MNNLKTSMQLNSEDSVVVPPKESLLPQNAAPQEQTVNLEEDRKEKRKASDRKYYWDNKERFGEIRKIRTRLAMRRRRERPEVRKKEKVEGQLWRNQEKNKLWVKSYNRNYALKNNYGISREYYDLLIKQQNNLCAICKRPETRTYKGQLRKLCVDHAHKTQKVRALLCSKCNTALGMLYEDPTILTNMINYIKLHSEELDDGPCNNGSPIIIKA